VSFVAEKVLVSPVGLSFPNIRRYASVRTPQ